MERPQGVAGLDLVADVHQLDPLATDLEAELQQGAVLVAGLVGDAEGGGGGLSAAQLLGGGGGAVHGQLVRSVTSGRDDGLLGLGQLREQGQGREEVSPFLTL